MRRFCSIFDFSSSSFYHFYLHSFLYIAFSMRLTSACNCVVRILMCRAFVRVCMQRFFVHVLATQKSAHEILRCTQSSQPHRAKLNCAVVIIVVVVVDVTLLFTLHGAHVDRLISTHIMSSCTFHANFFTHSQKWNLNSYDTLFLFCVCYSFRYSQSFFHSSFCCCCCCWCGVGCLLRYNYLFLRFIASPRINGRICV